MIQLTEAAIQRLQSLLQEQSASTVFLRIAVESGGCAGRQYAMRLDQPTPEDHVFSHDNVGVVVDPQSLAFLSGSRIDYCDDLAGAGFRIQNPNAARSCGCGTSFESRTEESAHSAH
jgi:iron-sulfur cluster assembly accessory protein